MILNKATASHATRNKNRSLLTGFCFQCGEHTQDGTVSSQNVSNIIEKATRLTVKNKLEKVLRQTELQKTEDEEDDIPDVNATIGHLKPRRGKQSVVCTYVIAPFGNKLSSVYPHKSK